MRSAHLFETLHQVRDEAQLLLDQQQLECLDKIQVYDAVGAYSLSEHELFDWFLTTVRLRHIERARLSGWSVIDYVTLDDMPEAERLTDNMYGTQLLAEVEPRKRGRRALGRQAIDSGLRLLKLGRQMHVGDPTIELMEYELDADSLYSPNGDELCNRLSQFVYDWQSFRASEGRTIE